MNEDSWAAVADGVIDSSGHDNHCTKFGATPTVSGVLNGAASFDGNDYIYNCGLDELNGITNFTVAGWVKYNILTENDIIFWRGTATTDRIALSSGAAGSAGSKNSLTAMIGNTTNTWAYTGSILSVGKWFHVAFVYSGSEAENTDRIKVYYNGVSQNLTFSATILTDTCNTEQ